MTKSETDSAVLARLILAIDPESVPDPSWEKVRALAERQVSGLELMVPLVPEPETLASMARAFDPGFDTVSSARVIGLSDTDKAVLLQRMRQVYAAAIGAEAQLEGVPPAARDWWHCLGPASHATLASGMKGIADRHWRDASLVENYDPSGLFVVRNSNIGPMLVEWRQDGGQPGLYPCRPAGEPDEGRWHIRLSDMERWLAVPFPRSAIGWHELFRTEGRPQADEATVDAIRKGFEKVKTSALDADGSDAAVAADLEAFFALVRKTAGRG